MSGAGRKVFQPGEVLTASNVQNYLQDQAVQYYAGTAARGSAIGTATTEGMMSYLADTNSVQMATGTATWVNVDSIPIVSGTATRDALYPSPVQGNTVFRTDKGWEETYFSLYNASTNPGGVVTAGWYPVSGNLPQAKLVRNTTAAVWASGAWNVASNLTYWDTEIAGSGGVTIETNGTLKTTLPGMYEASVGTMNGGITFTILSLKLNSTSVDSTGQIAVATAMGGQGWNGANIKANVRLAANDYIFWAFYAINSTTSTYQWTYDSNRKASFLQLKYISPPWGA